MPNRVTMSDVARQAGVSLMTVSRVINHKGDVNPETRQRVLEIVKSLDYRPSDIARSLATQQTRTIGLVIPDVSNPFFADIVRGIEHLAYIQGYHVYLCNTDEDASRELSVIQSLEDKRVDGLILCSSRLDEETLLELLGRLPAVVLINRRLKPEQENIYQSISQDDEQAERQATAHLIRRGHTRIGFLGGPRYAFSGVGRRAGYRAAMAAVGLPIDPEWMVHCPPTVDGGYQSAIKLLTDHPELTALLCYNDLVAVGVLQACIELNRRVPDDLAIIGYDDIPMARLVSPSLTTCQVKRTELGVKAVEALLDRLRDCTGGCRPIVLTSDLIIRQSAP